MNLSLSYTVYSGLGQKSTMVIYKFPQQFAQGKHSRSIIRWNFRIAVILRCVLHQIQQFMDLFVHITIVLALLSFLS
uniref:Uncharacterized protein n=1 Tax=Arundo donax TaxID=35708 RepID=A0A0A9GDA2_ARUDO